MQPQVADSALRARHFDAAIPAAAAPLYRPFGTFRFGLALFVALHHFKRFLAPGYRDAILALGFGIIAVMIFFVVSGFVVAEANAAFYRGRPLAFMANRLLRLAPPYFAALALSIAVHGLIFRSGNLALWYYTDRSNPLTFERIAAGISGLMPGLDHVLPVKSFEFIPYIWTLRFEMAFYLAVTATLLLAARGFGRGAIAAAIVVTMAASFYAMSRAHPGGLCTAPMFLCGVAVWLALEKGGAAWGGVALAVGAAGLGFVAPAHDAAALPYVQLAILAALFATFTMLAAWRGPLPWRAMDRRLGDLSYPLYLNHYIVVVALNDLTASRGFAIFAAGMVISVVLAALMGQLVDAPLRAVRNRVRGQVI